MLAVLTTCCAEKSRDPEPLPAEARYLHPRIARSRNLADTKRAPLLIFSGRYGVIGAEHPVPYYDHLLAVDEAGPMAITAAGQLAALGVTELLFVTESLDADPNLAPYHHAVIEACRQAGIQLSWHTGETA